MHARGPKSVGGLKSGFDMVVLSRELCGCGCAGVLVCLVGHMSWPVMLGELVRSVEGGVD